MGQNLRSLDEKNQLSAIWMHAIGCDVFLVVCLVLCAKVVGATSTEGFLAGV